jgi:hypothetical protein
MKDEMAEWSRWCFKELFTMTLQALGIYAVLLGTFWLTIG